MCLMQMDRKAEYNIGNGENNYCEWPDFFLLSIHLSALHMLSEYCLVIVLNNVKSAQYFF